MVTRLIALLLLALPCYGQIAFTYTDQPILSTDGAAVVTPIVEPDEIEHISRWWRYDTYPTNFYDFGNWTNVFAGLETLNALNAPNFSMVNYPNGIRYAKSEFRGWTIGDAGSGNINLGNSNTVWALFRPQSLEANPSRSFLWYGSALYNLIVSGTNGVAYYGNFTLASSAMATNGLYNVAVASSRLTPDGKAELYLNGTSITNLTDASLSGDVLFDFAGADGSGGRFWGEILEYAIYTNTLTAGQIAQLHRYATNKYEGWVSNGSWNPTTNSSALSVYDVASIAGNDGDAIGTLEDLTPSAYHLLSTGAARPYWTNSTSIINNQPFAFFDGSDDYLQTNYTITYPQPTTVFLVAQNRGQAGTYSAWFDNGDPAVYQLVVEFNNGGVVQYDCGTTQFTPALKSSWLHDWFIMEFHFNGASSYVKLDDGILESGQNVGANGRKGLTVGASRTLTLPGTISLAWMGIYTNTLSATESSNIVFYLNNRFHLINQKNL